MISLDPHSDVPLVRQIRDALALQIDRGTLAVGARLPSVRELARESGVSTMTATNAYQRLVADGYVEARPASGYYVAAHGDTAGQAARRKPFVGRTAVDSLWLIRRVYEDDASLLNAGCGWIPPEWLQSDAVRRALAGLARKQGPALARYGSPHGYLPLRQQIEAQLGARAIQAPPHQIVLTHGATQALALAGRCLLQPGDAVLVDDPGSTNLFETLRQLGARLVGVPRLQDGPDLTALQALAQRHRPKAFFIQTQLHNPTGSSCAPAKAYQLLRLAEQLGFAIVENDVMAGLEPPGTTSLASLDQLRRVIYVGGFSKLVSPSLRVGFVTANEEMVDKLIHAKMGDSLTSSETNERLVHAVLAEGKHRAHVARLAQRLAEAQVAVCAGLAKAGLEVFGQPAGGPFLWARLPSEGVDAVAVAQRAVAAGLLLAPGHLFRPTAERTGWMRFNAAYADDARVYEFVAREAAEAGKA
ncbi:PLP-dependent aminotransferase family protein [uncultured Pseudacidovorax sp.]|uniref:aminotransferase-like domain-containing protein n=1 Tax=uncultured Pseudacidovorax sp. TaxID=679313 RepID=UPI0025FADD1D|nr:PLP-dependent aminotransferase family protein [uncultured Pseudacidovorax sp.]